MNPLAVVIGFVPLVLFAFLDGRIPVAIAAATAAVAALIVALATARRGTPNLAIVQLITLGLIGVLAFTGGAATRNFLTTYGRAFASLTLAAFMLLTAPFAPFTAAIARANAPREVWKSPRFLEVNRKISAVWGLAVLVPGLVGLASAALGAAMPELHSPMLQWAPTVVMVIIAVRYTNCTVVQARSSQPAAAQPQRPY